jgi:2-polyprenyl-3-methyl-5-hydroxy-6-metoxy-1,4-benzoquinol methylase
MTKTQASHSSSPQAAPVSPETLKLDFVHDLRVDFPQEFGPAWEATDAVLQRLAGANLLPLARHSPGLKGYDWTAYIRLSAIRLVRIGAALRRAGMTMGRVLDFGSYFGNFALFARRLGFDVDAADSYNGYDGAFDPFLKVLAENGVNVIDLDSAGRDLSSLPSSGYDAIFCMGVIEHVPHTPRLLLQSLDRLLRPGGQLILDTPNLLYIYTREKLAAGLSIFPSIEVQFDVQPPFEGHHREYTPREVAWMLEAIGHEVSELETYNYSIYGLSELSGADAKRFEMMKLDPELRELIMARSTKRAT